MKSLGENPHDEVVCDAKVSKDVKSEYSEAELEVVSYLLICGPGGQGVTKEAGKESVSATWEMFIRPSTSPLDKSDNQRPEMVSTSLTHESRQGAASMGSRRP